MTRDFLQFLEDQAGFSEQGSLCFAQAKCLVFSSFRYSLWDMVLRFSAVFACPGREVPVRSCRLWTRDTSCFDACLWHYVPGSLPKGVDTQHAVCQVLLCSWPPDLSGSHMGDSYRDTAPVLDVGLLGCTVANQAPGLQHLRKTLGGDTRISLGLLRSWQHHVADVLPHAGQCLFWVLLAQRN